MGLIQSTSGNGTSFTLNGVAQGNNLILFNNITRNPTTGAGIATPTDTQGTWSVAINGVPATYPFGDLGTAIFYQENASSGTHTVTPETGSGRRCTLSEWSGLKPSGSFDVSKDAKTNNGTQTSQVTGTTNATSQNGELIVIAICLGASPGVADVGFTDPVSGFTTIHRISNDNSDLASFFAYKTVSATGTQSATFNWTDNEASQGSHGSIATFILSGPTINTQPTNQTVYAGQTAAFSVSATASAGALHYQWVKNGSNVGTDSSTYTTAALTLADANSTIRCDVTDDNGTTSSQTVYLFVQPTAAVAWIHI